MAEPKSSSSFDSLPLPGKLLLLGLLLALVTALYYFLLHMSLEEDISRAEQNHRQLLDQRQEAERRQQEYLQATQELASREATDRANKRVLPEDAEIPAFLADLNREAELAGLEFTRVEPQPEETEDLYTRIPVQLEMKGRFHQVARFFYAVSRLQRAINMEDISLGEPEVDEETEEVSVNVSVLATTFRRPSAGDAS
ncbi:MAG: type 4a pilus biogenesis protein PilO [Myxococcota bacterium]